MARICGEKAFPTIVTADVCDVVGIGFGAVGLLTGGVVTVFCWAGGVVVCACCVGTGGVADAGCCTVSCCAGVCVTVGAHPAPNSAKMALPPNTTRLSTVDVVILLDCE